MLVLFCAVRVFAQNGIITELTGTVELKHSGQADFVPASAGDTVENNTIVSTGLKSTALITAGSAVLTVRPLTRLSFSEIKSAAESETINVNLQTGRVRVDVTPPTGTKTEFTIRSPTTTASVRGTSFEFDTQSINVLEGTVSFQGGGNQVMLVGAGSSSDIGANGKPADPIETYTASLLPPSPAGRDAGYRYIPASGISIPSGEIGFIIDLR